ncbi:phospholipase-like protein [Artemisia annua]|uniref:Phospholipase-like protein n=1 Tax=Artemisia annua TaxID=35608 RepID=A0A2U1QL58_ARTAN|nr:phospholipase-like protein [Artemisia annua]
MTPHFHRVPIYDTKVSLRTKLHILKTIAKNLAYKEERYKMFKKTVFGPWLNLKTDNSDNHMLNFLLQHQRIIENPSTNEPFYFDIGPHSLQFGRKEFCLLTGFKFGKCSLKQFKEVASSFRARVFPTNAPVKGYNLLPLVESGADFAKLSDADAVRCCLLLALEYVFMGYELRHVWYFLRLGCLFEFGPLVGILKIGLFVLNLAFVLDIRCGGAISGDCSCDPCLWFYHWDITNRCLVLKILIEDYV